MDGDDRRAEPALSRHDHYGGDQRNVVQISACNAGQQAGAAAGTGDAEGSLDLDDLSGIENVPRIKCAL